MNSRTTRVRTSIIVPVFNGWEVTQRCLESIARTAQGAAVEVLVVDNGSTDATRNELARISAEGALKVLRNERNESFSKANNLGAALAQGEFLLFLNNDTQVLPGWLEALEQTFAADPSIGIQGGKLLYPDGRIQHAGIVYGPVNAEGLHLHYHLHLLADRDAPYVNRPREFQMVTGALLAIRRELFDRVGGFDEQYYFGHEDLDLCMKVRAAGYRVWYNPGASAIHYESLTKKMRGVEQFERYITHPQSFDAANDRLFHSRWDNLLVADADRYYAEDGVASPFGIASPRGTSGMRILMTMFGWTESGGGTTFPRSFAKRLARHGHKVSVFYAAGRHPSIRDPYHLERSDEDGVTVYGLYNRGSVFLDAEAPDREVHDPPAVARFRQVLDTEQPEIVHLHNLLGLSFEVARAAKATGVPVVFTPYNYHLVDPLLYMIGQDLRRWDGLDFFRNSPIAQRRPELSAGFRRRTEAAREMLCRDIDYVFAVSSRVREILVEFGARADRTLVVHQIHETVETLSGISRPRTPAKRPVRFGYLGGVMPHKGIHMIARAAQTLPSGAATFSIHGFVADDYRAALESIDRQHRLTFRGAYAPADLPAIAGAVDIMILPSLWEDCAPFSITESLAMGCPVVVPAIGGFPDFVRDGWNGRVFPAGDEAALERILGEIVADPSVIARWSAHTALSITFEDHVRHVEHLYRMITQGKPVQPGVHDLCFNSIDARTPAEPEVGMNRRRLEHNVDGGFSNRDAAGKLPRPLPSPLYLNLGCGNDVRNGFVNIDLFSDDASVVRMDIRRLELPDASVDGLVAHDVLEHFSHREVDEVLREWARVMKPGAEFMVRCPSLSLQCKAYLSGTWDADVAAYMIFGGQTNPGDYHCTGFDRDSITRHLRSAGLEVSSVREDDTPQDRGFINLNMTVKGRKTGGPERATPAHARHLRVVWEGEQTARHSLALVNRELCRRVGKRPEIELSIAGTGREPASVDVHVRHRWPADLQPPARGHWVVMQPWEYGSLPKDWVDAFRDTVDEFWVSSNHVRDCYVQSGIPADRVVVIAHGVDGERFRPEVRPLALDTRKKFKFLFVGGTLHRKGFDLLLEAYGKAFRNTDNVCLVVKDMGGPELYEGVNARRLIQEFTADPDHPAIVYLEHSLSDDEMPGLYTAADCLVHPYRGEGFGLPIAEAMAAALPVIVTGAGAAMDFCSERTAFLIPARKGRFTEKRIGGVETVDFPWLFEPDVEALAEAMRYVRTHRAEAREKARAAREHVLTALTWDQAADRVAGRLEALRSMPVRRHTVVSVAGNRQEGKRPMISSHPRVETALRRARDLETCDRTAEAEAILSALAQSAPDDPAVPMAHVRLLIRAHRFEEASALITATPMGLKNDPAWLELTAECLEGTGELEAADGCAASILERSPRAVSALMVRGRVAGTKGDSAGAERFYRAAISADPEAGEPRALLGSLFLQQGNTAEGIAMLEEGFRRAPLNGDILVTLVDALRKVNDLERAAALVGAAAAEAPASKRLRYFHAEILAQLDRQEEALSVVLGCLAEFGVEDEALAFALSLRLRIGPKEAPADIPQGHRVSACMIIKNEEHYLARCLWSVHPIVHEIVVLDTGSTDRSEEIAAAFGARIFRADWNNDFADARNRSLEPATGDWILILDGDEVIAPADHAAFRALVSAPAGPTAYSFVTRNYLVPMNVIGWTANDGTYAEEAGTGWIPSEKTRLFPRRPGIRFENPVHELVERSLQEAGISVSPADIPVHHYGKLDATRTKEKAEVYLELGRKKLAEVGTNDIKAIFELAFQENDLGNYEEALRLYRRILELNPGIPKVHFALGANLGTLRRYDEAVPALERSIALDPALKEAYVHLALVQLARGNHAAALDAAERLAALGIEYPPGTALLAATRFVAGDIDGGRRALAPLEQRGMSFHQYFTEFARHLRSEGKAEFAVRILEPFVAGEETPQDLALLLVECYRDVAMAPAVHEPNL